MKFNFHYFRLVTRLAGWQPAAGKRSPPSSSMSSSSYLSSFFSFPSSHPRYVPCTCPHRNPCPHPRPSPRPGSHPGLVTLPCPHPCLHLRPRLLPCRRPPHPHPNVHLPISRYGVTLKQLRELMESRGYDGVQKVKQQTAKDQKSHICFQVLELGGVHEIARRLNTSEARFVFFLHLKPGGIVNIFCQSFPHYWLRGPLALKCSPENVEQIQQSCQIKSTTCHSFPFGTTLSNHLQR